MEKNNLEKQLEINNVTNINNMNTEINSNEISIVETHVDTIEIPEVSVVLSDSYNFENSKNNDGNDYENDHENDQNDISLTQEPEISQNDETKNLENKKKNENFSYKRSHQLEYIQRTILRALWKHPKSWPFRAPVDPIKDNAKDYFDIVKNPMDLGTIRSKLLNGQYETAEECINDFRLIFNNCYIYNSEGLVIRSMCETLETFFNEKLAEMPTEDEEIDNTKAGGRTRFSQNKNQSRSNSATIKKRSRDSTIRPSIKYNNDILTNEIYKNGSNEQINNDIKKQSLTNTNQNITSNGSIASTNYILEPATLISNNSSNALKYCLTIVKELFTKKHADYAWPFYDPVDPNVLQLGDYDQIIHYPVDLSTIKKRLELGKYSTAFECITELKRMVTNCFRYNPEEHIVVQSGQRLIVAIEMLIARAPPDIFDFLVVVPKNLIIPNIDSIATVTPSQANVNNLNNVHLNQLEQKMQKVYDELNQIKSNKKKLTKLKKDDFLNSDNDSFDDDYVNPLVSKNHYGSGYTNVEITHAEPMTYEEKRKLSLEINRMPTDKLGEIIAFLSDIESDIFKEKNQSEVEIDFDSMKPETLRSLEKYVKYLNKPQKSRKKKQNLNQNSFNKNSITNISNPLTSTIKKLSLSNTTSSDQKISNIKNTNTMLVTSLPLSEESDISEDESVKVSQNITNISKSNNITHTTSKSSTLTFDTIDDSLLPSSMLNIPKKQEIASIDLINEAKAAVKQQKIDQLNQSNNSLQSNISYTQNNKHATSLLTLSHHSPSINTPEIRKDIDAPKAPTTLEEREKMKQEERQRRLALASATHSNIN